MEGMKLGFIKKFIVRIKEKSILKYGNYELVILIEKVSYLIKMLQYMLVKKKKILYYYFCSVKEIKRVWDNIEFKIF